MYLKGKFNFIPNESMAKSVISYPSSELFPVPLTKVCLKTKLNLLLFPWPMEMKKITVHTKTVITNAINTLLNRTHKEIRTT